MPDTRTNPPIALYRGASQPRNGSDDALWLCAAHYARSVGLCMQDYTVARTELGKPYFPGAPGICASVTHCKGVWICALSTTAVGVDAERHRAVDYLAIARRFFHPTEYEAVAHCHRLFFNIWTAKEAYLKYTGQGLSGGLGSFSVVSDGTIADTTSGAQLRHLPCDSDLFVCLCAPVIGTIIQYQLESL